MADKFDKLTKVLARSMGRREALRWMGTSVAGGALAVTGLKKAQAAETLPHRRNVCGGHPCNECGNPLGCGTDDPGKQGCFCTVKRVGNPPRCKCADNHFCSDPSARPCNDSSVCDRGWFCNTNCCGKVCSPRCGIEVPPLQRAEIARAAALQRGLTANG